VGVGAALAVLLLVPTACDSAGNPQSFAAAGASAAPRAAPSSGPSAPGPGPTSSSSAVPSSSAGSPAPRPTREPTAGPAPGPAPDEDGGQPVLLGCRGSCHVTLVGHGAGASFRGTRVSLQGVADGRADLRVGGRDVTCAAGEAVSVPPLRFTCTAVAGDAVMMTLSMR
jgi:hypothetical protein